MKYIIAFLRIVANPGMFLSKLQKLYKLSKLKKVDKFGYRKEMWRYKGLRIGDTSVIYPGVEILSEPYLVKIGENVMLTGGVKLLTHDGAPLIFREELGEKEVYGSIIIGDNVFIGMNSMILPNVKIGNNVIIGTSSVVTTNIPSNSIAIGNPAKVVIKASVYKNFVKKNKNLLYRVYLMPENDGIKMLFEHFKLDESDYPETFKYISGPPLI